MLIKYFTLATAFAVAITAAPIAAAEASPQEITTALGTLAIGKDGSTSFVPWYAPLIPGSEAKAKPWGIRPSEGYQAPRPAYDDYRPQYQGAQDGSRPW